MVASQIYIEITIMIVLILGNFMKMEILIHVDRIVMMKNLNV